MQYPYAKRCARLMAMPRLFRRGAAHINAFHPLPDAMMQLRRCFKQAMDPTGILNPRRMNPEWRLVIGNWQWEAHCR